MQASHKQPVSALAQRLRSWLGPMIFFALLTVLHTWPLASDPAHLSRNDNADAQLNAWIVSWVAHELPRDPSRLFEANIFYPEHRALAFSEPLLVPGGLAIPLRGLGASAVLTFNLLLMAGFFVTGLAGYWLGTHLTQDRLAGLLAGSLVAFGPHTLTRLPHLQAQWIPTLPLALLALDAFVVRGRLRAALALGLCLGLLAMTSGYGLALAVVAVAVSLLARVDEWWRRWRRLVPRLVVGALLSLVLALPVLWPYWRMANDQGVRRQPHESASFAALPSSFLSTPARLHHGLWSWRFDRSQGGSYFPGVTALALAVVGLAAGRGWRQPRVRMLAAIALAGAALALGPATPLYGALQRAFPLMRGLRDPSRFGALFVLGIGLLAAMGLAAWRRRLRGHGRMAVSLTALALAHVEVACAPLVFTPYEGLPPIYARLAQEPDRVALAEFPFHSGSRIYLNAAYVLASTAHWTPLVNGYSGIVPSGFERRAETLRHFPDPSALDELRRLGVSHVIVHLGRYRQRRQRRILTLLGKRDDIAWVARDADNDQLFRIRR